MQNFIIWRQALIEHLEHHDISWPSNWVTFCEPWVWPSHHRIGTTCPPVIESRRPLQFDPMSILTRSPCSWLWFMRSVKILCLGLVVTFLEQKDVREFTDTSISKGWYLFKYAELMLLKYRLQNLMTSEEPRLMAWERSCKKKQQIFEVMPIGPCSL